jgi:hypothetical protein
MFLLNAAVALVFFVLLVVAGIALLLFTSPGQALVRSMIAERAEQPPGGVTPHDTAINALTIMADDITTPKTELVSATAPLPFAVVVADGETRRTYPLYQGRQVLLGRGPEHEIALTDKQVSRRHALLRPAAESIELIDLGSSNGTFVGELKRKLMPNTPEVLYAGDCFWIGQNVKIAVK